MDIIFLIVWALAIYFIPAIIAEFKNHPNSTAIFVLNLFLGGRMIHLLWWNHWRDYLRKAKAERDPIVRDVWCRSAAIAQANYLMHAACYWQGVRP